VKLFLGNSRVEQKIIVFILESLRQIESLGHRKRFEIFKLSPLSLVIITAIPLGFCCRSFAPHIKYFIDMSLV
jgi:hypothetical protein